MQKSMQLNQLDDSQQHQDKKPAQDQKLASRYILAQLLATVLLSAVLLIYDFTVAYSAFMGGVIATLANAWLAFKVFRVKPEVAPEVLLAAFYVGEINKFILTGAMFVIVFVSIEQLNIVALLGIYFTIHMIPAMMNAFNWGGQLEISGKVKD